MSNVKNSIMKKCRAQLSKRCVVRVKKLSSREIEVHTRWRKRFQNNHLSNSHQDQEVKSDLHTYRKPSKTSKPNKDYEKRKYCALSLIENLRKDYKTNNPISSQSERNNDEVINIPSRPTNGKCKKTKNNVKSSSSKTNSSFPYSSLNDHHVSSDVGSQPMNVSYNSSLSDLPTGTSVSSVNLVSKSSNARYCVKSPRDRQSEATERDDKFLQRLEVYSKNNGDRRFLYKQKKLPNTAEKQKFSGNKKRGPALDGNTIKIKPTEGTDSEPLLPPYLGTVGSIRKHNQSRNTLIGLDEPSSSIDHAQANKDKTEQISSSPSFKISKTSISFNNNNLTSCQGGNPHKNDDVNKIGTCSQNNERKSFVSPFQKEFAKHTMTKEATHTHTKSSDKKTDTTTTDSNFTSFIYGKKNVTDRFNSVVARKRKYAYEKSDENAGHRDKRSCPGGTNITIDPPETLATNGDSLPQNNNPIKVKQQMNGNEKGTASEGYVLSDQTIKPLSKAQIDPLNISQDKKCKKIRNKKSKSLEEKFCLLFGEDEDYYVNKENTLDNNRTTAQGHTSNINVGSTPNDIDDGIDKTSQDEVDPLSIETSSCPPTEEIKTADSEGALDITSLGLDTLDKLFPSMVAYTQNQENNINVLSGSETENATRAVGKIQGSLQATLYKSVQDVVISVIDSTDCGVTKVIERGADNCVSENHTHNRNNSENRAPNKRLNENVQPIDTPIQNNYTLIQTDAGKVVENTAKVDGIDNKVDKLVRDINVGSDKHTQERQCGTNEESSNAQQDLHVSVDKKGVQQSFVEPDSSGSRNIFDTNPISKHKSAGERSNNPENTSPIINTQDSENNDSTALADKNGASPEKGEAAVNCGSDTTLNKSCSDRIRVRTSQFLMAKDHQLTELQLMGSPNLLWMQSLNSSDQSPANSTAGPAPESGPSGNPSHLQPMTVSNYSSIETRPLNKSLETDSACGVTPQDKSLAFENENVAVTTLVNSIILDSVKLSQLSELIYTIILGIRRFHCCKLEAKRLSIMVAQMEASAAQSSLNSCVVSKLKHFIRLLGTNFDCFKNYYFSKCVHNKIVLHFPESNILHNEVLKCFDFVYATHQQLIAHCMVQREKRGSSNSSQIQGDKTLQPSVVASQQHGFQQAYPAPVSQFNNSQANYSASWDRAPAPASSVAHGNFSDNSLGSTRRNNSLPQSNNDPILNQNGTPPSYDNHFSVCQSSQNQQNLAPTNVNVGPPTNVFANNIYNQRAPNVNPFQDSSHRINSQDSSSINLHSLLQPNSCFETPNRPSVPPRLNNYYHHSNGINVQQPRAGVAPNASPLVNSNLDGSGGQLHLGYRAATTSFQAGSPTTQENQNYQHQTPKEPPAASTGVEMSLQTTKNNLTNTNLNSSTTKPSTSKYSKQPKKVGETKRKSLPKKVSATNAPKPVGPAPQMSNQPPTNAEPDFVNARQARLMNYISSSINNNYARDEYLGQQMLHQNQLYQQNSFSNIASGYPGEVNSTNAVQGNASKRSEHFDRNRYPSAAAPYADGNQNPYRQQARPDESSSSEHGSFPQSSVTQQYTAPQYHSYHPQMISSGDLRQTAVQPAVAQNTASRMSQQYPGQQQNPSRPSVNPVAQYSAPYPQSTVNSQYTSPAVNNNSHSVPVRPANIAQPGAPTLTIPPLAVSKTQAYVSEGSLPNQDTLRFKGIQSRISQLLQYRKNNNLPMHHQINFPHPESLQQNPQTSLGQADIHGGGGQTQNPGQKKTPVVDTLQMQKSYQRLFEESVKDKLGYNPSIVGPSKNQNDKVACRSMLQTQFKSAQNPDSTLKHNTQQEETSSGNLALNTLAFEPRQEKGVPFNRNATPPKHHASAINQHNQPQNLHNPPPNVHTTPLNQYTPPSYGGTTPHNQHAAPPNQHNPDLNVYTTPNQHNPAPNVHITPPYGQTTPHNRHATPPNQHNPAPIVHTTPPNQHNPAPNVYTTPNQHNPAPNVHTTLPNQHNPAPNVYTTPNQHNPAPIVHATPHNQHNPAPNGQTIPHNRHTTHPNQHNPAPNGQTTPHNRHTTPPNQHNPAPNVYTTPNQHNPAPYGQTTPHNRHATPPNQYNPAPNVYTTPNQHNPAPYGQTTPHNRHATPPNQHNPAPNGQTTPHNRHATPPNQHNPAPNQLVTLPGQYTPPLNKLSLLTRQNSSPQQIGDKPRRSSTSQSRLMKLLTSPSMSVQEPPRANYQNDVIMVYEDLQEPRTLSRDSGYKTPSPMEAPQIKEQSQNGAVVPTDNDDDSWLIKLKEPTNCLLCDRQAAEACSSCRKAFYCSKACQVKHWEESHYADCVPEHASNNLD